MSYDGPERATDPWEHADPSYGQIDLGYQSGYYDNPAQPVPNQGGSRALLAVLVTVLVLVLCGGGVTALYLIGGKGGQPTGAATTGSSGSPATSVSPKFDPTSITVGQCLVITGPPDAPVVEPGSCDPGNFKVVKRIDGTHNSDVCKGITRWNYFYDTTPDSNDFVACLQKL